MKLQYRNAMVFAIALTMTFAGGAFAVDVTDVASLEAAIAAGADGETINLAAGTYVITQPIVLKDNQTFKGAGAATTIIDGGDAMRIFEALGDPDPGVPGDFLPGTGQIGWTLDGLTLTKGLAHGASAGNDDGGAICIRAGGWGTLQNCILSENEATSGGAIDISGPPDNATFSIINCELINNFAPVGQGGAMDYRVSGGNDSGSNNTTLFIDSCLFMGNIAGDASNAEDGAAFHSRTPNAANVDSNYFILNSVFINNTQTDDSTFETRGNTEVKNCTFVGNTSADRGVITANPEGDLLTRSTFLYTNNLFVGNVDEDGDSVINARQGDALITATNNLFFNNTDGTAAVPNTNGNLSVETGSVTGDPLLDPTTYVPAAGSAAIDTSEVATALADDYNGNPAIGTRDIGAFELGSAGIFGGSGGGDGDGDGDGGGGTTAVPEAGMPVAGAIGLGLVAAACALGGALAIRRKK